MAGNEYESKCNGNDEKTGAPGSWAEGPFPFLGEGVAAGRGRGVCPVSKAVPCPRNGMDSIMNPDDFHITTPPFGHPFLKRRGIRPHGTDCKSNSKNFAC